MSDRLVDLTHPIRTGMPVYPGDPGVEMSRALTAHADGVNVRRISCGSHTGTHVDSPYHVGDELPDLDELPLERFVGTAVIIDARGAPERGPLDGGLLDPVHDRLEPGVIVLFATGWDRHWQHPRYLAHPALTLAAAQRLLDAGVLTVGVDTFSVDITADPDADPGPDADPAAGRLPVHQLLARAGCVIVENLRGLGTLLDAQHEGAVIDVSLLPLRLEHADGAPIRAVARIRQR